MKKKLTKDEKYCFDNCKEMKKCPEGLRIIKKMNEEQKKKKYWNPTLCQFCSQNKWYLKMTVMGFKYIQKWNICKSCYNKYIIKNISKEYKK